MTIRRIWTKECINKLIAFLDKKAVLESKSHNHENFERKHAPSPAGSGRAAP